MQITPTTSQPTTSPTPLETARMVIVDAQGYAGSAVDDPAHTSVRELTWGAQDALDASALLLEASPRSRFQDLTAASAFASQGAAALQRAASALQQVEPAETTFANVKLHAKAAFDALEQALEIIDND